MEIDIMKKLENTSENKSKFFALYWEQAVLIRNVNDPQYDDVISMTAYNYSGWLSRSVLELKPLSSISDDEAIEVSKIIFPNLSDPIFKISLGYERSNGLHIDQSVLCIECSGFINNPVAPKHYLYGLIQIDLEENDIITGYFQDDGNEFRDDHSDNILHAYDYVRSNGYALPFMGLSVEDLIEYGWIKKSLSYEKDIIRKGETESN